MPHKDREFKLQFCVILAEVGCTHPDSILSKLEFCYLTAACKRKFTQALHTPFLKHLWIIWMAVD
jgi:hypothetical protein